MNLRHVALPAVLLLGGCSTNPEASAPPPPTERDYIRMSRGPCFGACPMYEVTVWGDGRVRFVGNQFVEKTGEHSKTIDVRRAAELFARADSIGFFEMPQQVTPANESACGQYHTDAPSAEIEMFWRDRDQTVSHYHGCSKAPAGLRAFQDRIDAVLGTAEWIGRRP